MIEPKSQNSFSYEEILQCGNGELFGVGNAQLPLPPMLMFTSIPKITDEGGAYGKGEMTAELDLKPDMWFFDCHFKNDPVMPGCLGVDSLWQMLGFYLGWIGGKGRGRAFGAGNIKFSDQILPNSKKVIYHLDIKKIVNRQLVLGVANGQVEVDGKKLYDCQDLKVGLVPSND